MDSLSENWEEGNKRIYDVNFFTNLVSVLGEGLLRYEKANLSRGEKEPLLDTDQFVNLVLTSKKRIARKEPVDEIVIRIVQEKLGMRTFGRFFLYLLMMLSRMKLGVPDLGRYLDPDLPMMITRES